MRYPLSPIPLLTVLLLTFLFNEANAGEQASRSAPPSPPAAVAQSPAFIQCFSLDVVFVIDQSDSMQGNDKYQLRVYAARWAIDWLASHAKFNCPDAAHRIGVVNFGGAGERPDAAGGKDLELTLVEGDTQALRDQIKPLKMGQTDYRSAFSKAVAMLERAAAAPLGRLPRKRAIIFVTDGDPCIYQFGCPDNIDRAAIRPYMEDLESDLATSLPFAPSLLAREDAIQAALSAEAADELLPPADAMNQIIAEYPVPDSAFAESVYVWAVLLQKSANEPYYPEVIQVLGDITARHGGERILNVKNETDTIVSILKALVRVSLTGAKEISCGDYFMLPYLKKVTINIFHVVPSAKGQLSYTDAAGQTHVVREGTGDTAALGNSVDYSLNSTIETYLIARPQPGRWNIFSEGDCDLGVRIYIDSLGSTASAVEPGAGQIPQYDLGDCVDPADQRFISYQMQDDVTGDLIGEAPAYPLDITGVITPPTHSASPTVPISLKFDPATTSFRSSLPIPVCQKGEYEFEVTATTNNPNPAATADDPDPEKRQPYVVFTDRNRYRVSPVTPFLFKIQRPAQGEAFPIHTDIATGLKVRPVKIEVKLTDRAGTALAPAQVFVDPKQALQALVSVGVLTDTVDLVPDAARPGMFIGQSSRLEAEGQYALTVSLVGQYQPQFRPDDRDDEVTFERYDRLVDKWIFWQGLGSAVALLILGLVAKIGYDHTNVVVGQLDFEVNGQALETLLLGKGRRVVRYGQRELERFPSLGLAALRVRNAPAQADAASVQDGGVSYPGQSPSSTSSVALRSVEVLYTPQGGIETPVVLEDGGAGELLPSHFMMRYRHAN